MSTEQYSYLKPKYDNNNNCKKCEKLKQRHKMEASSLLTQASKHKSWNLLHRAAAKNYFPRVKQLCQSFPHYLEARSSEGMTPLLISAQYGATDSFLVLIKAGSNRDVVSGSGLTVVQTAAALGHIHLLTSAINDSVYTQSRAFSEVCDYICSGQSSATSYTQVLHVLESLLKSLTSRRESSQEAKWLLMELDIIKVFEKALERCACEILISGTSSVAKSITATIPLLAQSISESKIPHLLISLITLIEDRNACRRALNVIANLIKHVRDSSTVIFALGGPLMLFRLLQRHQNSELHLAAMKCIGNDGTNPELAKHFTSPDILEGFMAILTPTHDSESLAATLTALQRLMESSCVIKSRSIDAGIVPRLVKILRPFDRALTEPCVKLLRTLCGSRDGRVEEELTGHPEAITVLLRITGYGTQVAVQQMALEILWYTTMGSLPERRALATLIGIESLVELAKFSNPELQMLGLSALKILSPAVHNLQTNIIKAGGIQLLLVTLRGSRSADTKLLALETLENLAYELGLQPNHEAQREMTEADGITMLLQMYRHDKESEIGLQIFCTLTAFSTKNKQNKQAILRAVSMAELLAPLQANKGVSLRYMRGVCLLGYQSQYVQSRMITNGGIMMDSFLHKMSTGNDAEKVEIAFQMIVLARVVIDSKPTQVMIFGLKQLTALLHKGLTDGNVDLQVAACTYISGLIQMRAGLSGALVSLNIISELATMLQSKQEATRRVAAVSLTFLTHHSSAVRYILNVFRKDPKWYTRLLQYNGDKELSEQFKESWKDFCRTNSILMKS